jgi:hypothetical protein
MLGVHLSPDCLPPLVPSLLSFQVPLGHRSATPGSEGGADSSDEEEQEEEEEVIDVPEVEWWDKALLPHASYAQDVEPAVEAGQPVTLKENKVRWVQGGRLWIETHSAACFGICPGFSSSKCLG